MQIDADLHLNRMMTYLAYPSIATDVFPDCYASARQCFLSLSENVSNIHIEHHAYQCLGETLEGDSLFTDTLWMGADDAKNVVVLLAGTHGVEGFVGSAVEVDHIGLLATGQLQLADDTAFLVVHALTPWGYAWLRRCDEDGVDLNRNAVDFAKPLPENPGYEALRSDLYCADNVKRKKAFAEFELQQGRTALEMAISGGQFIDPRGPFYGGVKSAHGRIVTENLIQHFRLQDRNLAVIDLHSGLGPYGYGEIICDHALGTAGIEVAQAWYGDSVTIPALGTSSSVPKVGLMDYIWHETMNERSCHVTLEFGSYSTDSLFEVLLTDH